MAGALSQTAKVTDKTVAAYVKALNDAYTFYPAKRNDLLGQGGAARLAQVMGYRTSDVGRAFENAVCLQLLHDGWPVYIGKLYQKEIDFVCLREGEVLYVQVTDSMTDESTRERELALLLSISDNHPKWVAARQVNLFVLTICLTMPAPEHRSLPCFSLSQNALCTKEKGRLYRTSE